VYWPSTTRSAIFPTSEPNTTQRKGEAQRKREYVCVCVCVVCVGFGYRALPCGCCQGRVAVKYYSPLILRTHTPLVRSYRCLTTQGCIFQSNLGNVAAGKRRTTPKRPSAQAPPRPELNNFAMADGGDIVRRRRALVWGLCGRGFHPTLSCCFLFCFFQHQEPAHRPRVPPTLTTEDSDPVDPDADVMGDVEGESESRSASAVRRRHDSMEIKAPSTPTASNLLGSSSVDGLSTSMRGSTLFGEDQTGMRSGILQLAMDPSHQGITAWLFPAGGGLLTHFVFRCPTFRVWSGVYISCLCPQRTPHCGGHRGGRHPLPRLCRSRRFCPCHHQRPRCRGTNTAHLCRGCWEPSLC
jgi:hypothetical protein